MGRPFSDLSNFKTETMEVLFRKGSTPEGKARWLCKCFCGNQYEATGTHIRNGNGKHCGCLKGKNISNGAKTHKKSRTKEFKSWCSMKSRCLNKNNRGYKNYGARGIKVCERWVESFSNFFEDMGLAPSPNHSIDRIDVNGNYEPSNCKWATWKEQASNRRNNIYIDFETRSLLFQRFGPSAIYQRSLWRIKNKGMGIADAVFQPAFIR
jgi:hypothetical protein